MYYRFFPLLVSFIFFTTAFAGPADVQSREVKVQICKNLVSEQFHLEGRRARTVESHCVNNGKFLAMEELRDSELNISTGLRVQFTYSYKDQLSAQGEALVLKNFRTSDEGQLSHSWEVRRLTLARLEDGDVRSTEDLLNEIGEAANVSNGSWNVSRFKVKKLNYEKELAKLEKELPNGMYDGECSFENYTTIQGSLGVLASDSWLEDEREAPTLLEKLQQKGLIINILGRGHVDGETEICTLWHFKVFTTDGWLLDLEYNFTD